jgi:hypothetical protein
MLSFFKTQRGKDKISYEGYQYTFDKLSKLDEEVKMWRCITRTCSGRLHTRNANVAASITHNLCFRNTALSDVAQFKSRIIEQSSKFCSIILNTK